MLRQPVINRHQILIAGADDSVVRTLVTRPAARGADFHRVPRAGEAARVAATFEFDVVVIRYPINDASVDSILERIRSPASRSRNAGVVLLAEDRRIDDARRYIGRGASRALSLDDPPPVWGNEVFELLDVARRVELHALVKVEHGGVSTSCRTEDVSTSGMLLRCARKLSIGSNLSFEISVPNDHSPIRGRATVARSTDPEREDVQGYGAAFESFEDTGRSRLRQLVQQSSN